MRVRSASLAGSLGGGIAVPILRRLIARAVCGDISLPSKRLACSSQLLRSEEHTSELQSLMRISYAVFCLKKKKQNKKSPDQQITPATMTKALQIYPCQSI